MFEGVPQELKDEAAKALRGAVEEAYALLDKADELVHGVTEQLNEWAAALENAQESESDNGPVLSDDPRDFRYLYLLRNAKDDEEYRMLVNSEDYLLSAHAEFVLEAMYQQKMREHAGGTENNNYDFWTVLREGFMNL